MSRQKKIWIGVLTISPLIFLILYFVFFFGFFFNIIAQAESGQEPNPELLMGFFAIVFIFIGLAVVLSFASLIYLIIHASNNPRLEGNDRTIWIVIIVLAGLVGNIIYWYVKIWSDPEA